MRSYPAQSLLRFFANHGLLQLGAAAMAHRRGGAATYVERLGAALRQRARLASPVRAVRRQATASRSSTAAAARQRFDQVVLACHADQALALIERRCPRARPARPFRYQRTARCCIAIRR